MEERGGAGSFGADPFGELKEDTTEYTVYDSHYEKIGQVDDLVVDEDDRVLYVGVKMGFFGTSSTLVPVEIVRVNDRRHLIEVSEPADTVKHAPRFGNSEDLTPELENHVRTYYGLEGLRPSPEHEARTEGTGVGAISPTPEVPEPDDLVDVSPGERLEAQDRYAAERPPERVESTSAERTPGERLESTASERTSGERLERASERRAPEDRTAGDRTAGDRPPDDRTYEEDSTRERTPGERPAAGRAGQQESISEPLSEPKSLGEQLSGGDRVTVHRIRR